MKNTSYIKNEVVNRFTIKRITEENKSDEEKNWEDDEIARLTRMLEEFKEFKSSILNEIRIIDQEYEIAKVKIYRFIATIAVMIIIQPAFTGFMKGIIPIVYFVVALVYFFKLSDVCTVPILTYLIEHRNKIVQGYVISNSIIPLSDRIKEIDVEIEYCVEQIVDLKNRES